jgi:hypothetical protein
MEGEEEEEENTFYFQYKTPIKGCQEVSIWLI